MQSNEGICAGPFGRELWLLEEHHNSKGENDLNSAGNTLLKETLQLVFSAQFKCFTAKLEYI